MPKNFYVFLPSPGGLELKNLIIGGVVVNLGYLLEQVPTIVLMVFVVCCFTLAALVLCNESACDRLIRILKVLLGRSDRVQNPKRQ